MLYFQLAIAFMALGVMGFFTYTMAKTYQATPGTALQKIIAAARGSLTILWSRFVALVGLATVGLTNVADFAGDPAVGAAIQTYLKPQYVAAAMVIIAIITEYARKRTLPPG